MTADDRACTTCGYTPPDVDERVVGACEPGYHELAMVWQSRDPGHVSPAIRDTMKVTLAVQARLVQAAKDLRELDLRGEFQTDAWWDALNRIRDCAATMDDEILAGIRAASERAA